MLFRSGGDIPPELAQYANSDLPKQTAVIKSGEQPPQRIKIPDVPDIVLDNKVFDSYVNKCLSHEWNFSPHEILDQMERRFKEAPAQAPPAETQPVDTQPKLRQNPTKKPAKKPTVKPPVKKSKKDIKTIFD